MRLTRVFVATALREGGEIELPADTATHVARVLRGRSGDELVLFNGDGTEFAAEIRAVRGNRVTVAVGGCAAVDHESPLAVTLLQGVPRGDRMDLIVQKATELGVRRIVPVISERGVVRLGPDQAAARVAHWRAIAAGACEQCHRNRLPGIDEPRPLLAWLGEPAPAQTLRLLLEPGAASEPVLPDPPGAAVEVAIGPEGGFSGTEVEAFRIAGFHPVGLGPRILRTETAAIAALCWLQTRYGDMVPT